MNRTEAEYFYGLTPDQRVSFVEGVLANRPSAGEIAAMFEETAPLSHDFCVAALLRYWREYLASTNRQSIRREVPCECRRIDVAVEFGEGDWTVRYAFEVKVSIADLRSELRSPLKRLPALKAYTFYSFALPWYLRALVDELRLLRNDYVWWVQPDASVQTQNPEWLQFSKPCLRPIELTSGL